jgi:hypothetical protein
MYLAAKQLDWIALKRRLPAWQLRRVRCFAQCRYRSNVRQYQALFCLLTKRKPALVIRAVQLVPGLRQEASSLANLALLRLQTGDDGVSGNAERREMFADCLGDIGRGKVRVMLFRHLPVFDKIAQDHADGIVFGTGSMMFNERARIGAAAIAHKLPALAYVAEEVPAEGAKPARCVACCD